MTVLAIIVFLLVILFSAKGKIKNRRKW